MRTNIDIDDDLMAAMMERSGKKTKKAAVEEAMRHYLKSARFRGFLKEIRGIGWDPGAERHAKGLNEEQADFDRRK